MADQADDTDALLDMINEQRVHHPQVKQHAPFERCGLNASWNCPAIHIGPGEAEITSGTLYILDLANDGASPNGELTLVQRRETVVDDPEFQPGDSPMIDDIRTLATVPGTRPSDVDELLHVADKVLHQLTLEDGVARTRHPRANRYEIPDAPSYPLKPDIDRAIQKQVEEASDLILETSNHYEYETGNEQSHYWLVETSEYRTFHLTVDFKEDPMDKSGRSMASDDISLDGTVVDLPDDLDAADGIEPTAADDPWTINDPREANEAVDGVIDRLKTLLDAVPRHDPDFTDDYPDSVFLSDVIDGIDDKNTLADNILLYPKDTEGDEIKAVFEPFTISVHEKPLLEDLAYELVEDHGPEILDQTDSTKLYYDETYLDDIEPANKQADSSLSP